jgi:hypothetical protein
VLFRPGRLDWISILAEWTGVLWLLPRPDEGPLTFRESPGVLDKSPSGDCVQYQSYVEPTLQVVHVVKSRRKESQHRLCSSMM